MSVVKAQLYAAQIELARLRALQAQAKPKPIPMRRGRWVKGLVLSVSRPLVADKRGNYCVEIAVPDWVAYRFTEDEGETWQKYYRESAAVKCMTVWFNHPPQVGQWTEAKVI